MRRSQSEMLFAIVIMRLGELLMVYHSNDTFLLNIYSYACEDVRLSPINACDELKEFENIGMC